MEPFNLSAYRTAFREACARRGIDPCAGATAYTVANLRADAIKAATARRPGRAWWRHAALWAYCAPYRSTAEAAALRTIFVQAWHAEYGDAPPEWEAESALLEREAALEY